MTSSLDMLNVSLQNKRILLILLDLEIQYASHSHPGLTQETEGNGNIPTASLWGLN